MDHDDDLAILRDRIQQGEDERADLAARMAALERQMTELLAFIHQAVIIQRI